MTDITDYPAAMRRVMFPDGSDEDVPDSMTDRNDVYQFLRNRSDNRVDAQIAAKVADGVVTDDMVAEAIENGGKVPTEQEIEDLAQVADNYGMSSRAETVGEQVARDVATVESIEAEISGRDATTEAEVREAVEAAGTVVGPEGGADEVAEQIPTVEQVEAEAGADEGPVFREDIEEAASSLASEADIGGDPGRTDAIEAEAVESAGAPSREEFRREGVQALTQNQVEVTAENTAGYDGAGEVVSVIESEGGETIGVVGSTGAAEAVAEETGAETIAGGTQGAEAFGLEQGDGEASLTLAGETVRSFDVG